MFAVVRIATESMAAPFQFLVQFVEYQIAQQRGEYSPNAKGNFQFDRVITGWRNRPVLDLRHKR